MTDPTCPRCLGYIPNNDAPGAYLGALSRTDNQTEICSPCGTEEAWDSFTCAVLTQDDWPVKSRRRVTTS